MRRFMGMFGNNQEEIIENALGGRLVENLGINLEDRYLVQDSNDLFVIIDAKGIVSFATEGGESFFGVQSKDMYGKNLFDFCCIEDSTTIQDMLKTVIRSPDKSTIKNTSKNDDSNNITYFEIRMMNYLKEPSIGGIVIVFRNITRKVQLEQSLDYISTHDKTTSLPNHILFQSRLKEACVEGRRERSNFALMIIDIYDFKYINNTLGYICGDQLISEIGHRITELVQERGFVSRYYGDQFSIIVTDFVDIENCTELVERILELFNEPFVVDKYEAYISVSIGVGVFPDDGSDAFSLERNASKALYYAKSEGKNNYKFYSSGGDISSFKHFELRNDLYKAIERNQLECHFQPIVNIKNGTILAAEAFIRWSHPTWGILNANEFIDLAEDSGLIVDIGKWILRDVCKNYSQWLKRGFSKINIHINYSSIQFFEKDFIENITEIINEFRLDPSFLVIELTEAILMHGDLSTVENIKTLQNLGIKIAVDDFGMGISSLNYLDSFNVDMLKLDKSFIKEIPDNINGSKILRALVNLAIDLDLKLVIKGIENWKQLSYLRGMNCRLGQGYVFSKALSVKQFERVLSKKVIRPIRQTTDTEFVEKRRFFRVEFLNHLEGVMTILEIGG